MKPLDWTYELHVIGTRPKVLPMDDFGVLVQRLADLLGSREHIRFGALRRGSARVLAKVLEPAVRDVTITLIRAKLGEDSVASKVVKIDEFLASRGWHGELRNRQGGVVIQFPGALNVKPVEQKLRTVQQVDSIIGTVIKIGGRDETVPMQIQTPEGRYVDVTVRGRGLARNLGSLLFQEVRVSGLATWQRNTDGEWSCIDMLVDEFDQPSVQSLDALFDELGRIEGNEWNSMHNPEAEWLKIRRGDQ